jgi:hypothetical protein
LDSSDGNDLLTADWKSLARPEITKRFDPDITGSSVNKSGVALTGPDRKAGSGRPMRLLHVTTKV